MKKLTNLQALALYCVLFQMKDSNIDFETGENLTKAIDHLLFANSLPASRNIQFCPDGGPLNGPDELYDLYFKAFMGHYGDNEGPIINEARQGRLFQYMTETDCITWWQIMKYLQENITEDSETMV